MWIGRRLGAWLVALALWAAATPIWPAAAQANFDRPGGDYLSAPVISGDPADCALVCERDRRCRAWTFAYPTDTAGGAVCWLKGSVPARVQDNCCVSGVRGAGVVEPKNSAIETSIDRFLTRNTRIGIRRTRDGYDVYAPDGFDDAAGLIVRPNPGPNFSPVNYEKKAARWKMLWPEITVLPVDDGAATTIHRRPGEGRDP